MVVIQAYQVAACLCYTGLSSRSLTVLYRPIKSQPDRVVQAYQVAACPCHTCLSSRNLSVLYRLIKSQPVRVIQLGNVSDGTRA